MSDGGGDGELSGVSSTMSMTIGSVGWSSKLELMSGIWPVNEATEGCIEGRAIGDWAVGSTTEGSVDVGVTGDWTGD